MTMQPLFSPQGEKALASTLLQRPLLAFDFDGTLAPIVARPADARLSPGVSTRLATLATHLPVAIVTGRTVDDVRGRLGFTPHHIVGNHGAEDASATTGGGPPAVELSRLRQRLQDHAPALTAAGVTVEDKGQSLALHYRLSPTRGLALRIIRDLLSDPGDDWRVFGGKLVVNVAPRDAPDKADAVQALVQRCGVTCAFFAGDDVNDEPVFAMAPGSWLTVRVGRADRTSRARFFVDGPAQMALLLERMVRLLTTG